MLEGVKASWRHQRAHRASWRWKALQPRPVRLSRKGGNNGRGEGPSLGFPPHESRPPWAEYPLVTAGNKEVASQIGHGHILYPKAVHSIHTQQHAVGLVAVRIHRRQSFCHATDG